MGGARYAAVRKSRGVDRCCRGRTCVFGGDRPLNLGGSDANSGQTNKKNTPSVTDGGCRTQIRSNARSRTSIRGDVCISTNRSTRLPHGVVLVRVSVAARPPRSLCERLRSRPAWRHVLPCDAGTTHERRSCASASDPALSVPDPVWVPSPSTAAARWARVLGRTTIRRRLGPVLGRRARRCTSTQSAFSSPPLGPAVDDAPQVGCGAAADGRRSLAHPGSGQPRPPILPRTEAGSAAECSSVTAGLALPRPSLWVQLRTCVACTRAPGRFAGDALLAEITRTDRGGNPSRVEPLCTAVCCLRATERERRLPSQHVVRSFPPTPIRRPHCWLERDGRGRRGQRSCVARRPRSGNRYKA